MGRQRGRRRPLLLRLRRRLPLDRRPEHPRHPQRQRSLREEGRQHRRGSRFDRPHHHLLLQWHEDSGILPELQPERNVLSGHQQLS